jgi:hypothetical protein
LPSAGTGKIMPLIRQVQVNLLRRNFVEAERLLKEGLERYPNDTELISHLGWVYRKWDPPRVTDARECFHRVWQFKGGPRPAKGRR